MTMTTAIDHAIRELEQDIEGLQGEIDERQKIVERLRALSGREPKRPAAAKTDAPASADDVLADRGDRVVGALKVKSPQSPGELQKASTLKKLSAYAFCALLRELATAGRIVREGTGRGAVVGLPGKSRAKEGL